jgi:pyruvate, water dikinase
MDDNKYILWFKDISSSDVEKVGGKNASLGEMIKNLKSQGINVPDGFATTAYAYRKLVEENNIGDKLHSLIGELENGSKLQDIGKKIRRLFMNVKFPEQLEKSIKENYKKLSDNYGEQEADVAVRSSATAEDLPEASFAGQQETFLNINGQEELLEACRKCYASLFTDRAISYRQEKDFSHMKVALSIGIQKMVRSDKSGAGVMFTIDTETGFDKVIEINAAWGLGENVVKGTINPDEYMVFKPVLEKDNFRPILKKFMGNKEKKMIYSRGGSKNTRNIDTSKKEQRTYVLDDEEIIELARWGKKIEEHYGKPMDIEWARDGETGEMMIVQARPETVQSQKGSEKLKSYRLKEKGKRIVSGKAIGDAISSGEACVIESADDISDFKEGSILVTGMTDPDWVPIMKKSKGLVTDHGGRTSHAAIVSRELGIAAIVGTSEGTKKIKDRSDITISCAEGSRGYVYEGKLEFETKEIKLEKIPDIKTKVMMNIASPAAAFSWWKIPCNGIGLARMEFIINNVIKVHPMALAKYDDIEDENIKDKIDDLCGDYENKEEYFIDNLAMGISQIAASRYPDSVIVRMSDFKTNEYANLIGGELFEPEEENPMLGFRGASRYYNEKYMEGFSLECSAIKKAREEIGLDNILIMIPFCRTVEEADRVLDMLDTNGVKKGKNGIEVYIMAEIPSNIMQAEEFAKKFDGFSIGSNDLTQLVLGIDRDSEELSGLFDENNDSVKRMIEILIDKAHSMDRPVSICGQGPSDSPDFVRFLVDKGIDSISLNPDAVMDTIEIIYKKENES